MKTLDDFIFDNLDNLGELDKHHIHYLCDNINIYYGETFNISSLDKLRHLLNVVSEEDFPQDFDLTEVHIKNIDGTICLVNKYKQICYEDNGKLFITIIPTEIDGNESRNINETIIERLNSDDKWKCKHHSSEYYNKRTNYTFHDKCIISITDNGEISTLLKDAEVKTIKDLDILKQTIELGGRLIESYKDEFEYYANHGFRPISICKWEDDIAPHEWIEANGYINDDNSIDYSFKEVPNNQLKYKRYDIIFYIYTNHQKTYKFNEWLDEVGYSNSYKEAKAKRNQIYKQYLNYLNGGNLNE